MSKISSFMCVLHIVFLVTHLELKIGMTQHAKIALSVVIIELRFVLGSVEN